MSKGPLKAAVGRLFGRAVDPEDRSTATGERAARGHAWHQYDGFVTPRFHVDEDCGGTALGSLGGGEQVMVDPLGWIAPTATPWSLDWAVRDGDGWKHAATSSVVSQELVAPAVVETSLALSSGGSVVQRLAVAVVAGAPALTLEIENRGSVAVATAVGIRPFGRDRAGVQAIRSLARAVQVDGRNALIYETPPRVTTFGTVALGDPFAELDTASAATATPPPAQCPDGGASATLVWPLPHTAVLRLSIPLHETSSTDLVVATPDEVNRGWVRHLESGFSFDVPDDRMSEHTAAALRDLLSRRPDDHEVSRWMAALAEAGFAETASAGLDAVDPGLDPGGTVAALARVVQLGDVESFGRAEQLAAEDVTPDMTWAERAVEPVARAAHIVHRQDRRRSSARADGRMPHWSVDRALNSLGATLRHEQQPDVAERVEALGGIASTSMPQPYERLQSMLAGVSATGAWADKHHHQAHSVGMSAMWVLDMRRLLLDDEGTDLRLLPEIPTRWRGQNIDAFKLPIEGGKLSFGLRWHGPRPALLWEIEPTDAALGWTVTVPGVDARWSSTELSGEDLLPDPGWPTD